jgi:hypothetical protein
MKEMGEADTRGKWVDRNNTGLNNKIVNNKVRRTRNKHTQLQQFPQTHQLNKLLNITNAFFE